MGFLPVPSSPARGAPSDRQVVLVFVPAENLRRICVVSQELLAGVLLLVGLALRSRWTGSSSAETKRRQLPEPQDVHRQLESGTGQLQQGSCEDSPSLRDINQGNNSLVSSQQNFTTGNHADDTTGSRSSVIVGCDDRDRGAGSVLEVSDENQRNGEHIGSGESNEEEASVEYGPFWPCPIHPPNQAQRFVDLTEEEQEEIMDADLEAYRNAWRPGDMKYILWNPDPDVADEDQGQEAFHDENYEFFWWTPTSYRTTREKHVFYDGNLTKYPIHGPVYCPRCDRHVWEALPKRGDRVHPVEQPDPATSASLQDSHQTEPDQGSPPEPPRDTTPAQDHPMSQTIELPLYLPVNTGGVNPCLGRNDPWQVPLGLGKDSGLFHPEGTVHEAMQDYQYRNQQVTGDPHEPFVHLTPDLASGQFGLRFDPNWPARPVWHTAPAAGCEMIERSADKAVQTDQDQHTGNSEDSYASNDQAPAAHHECEQEATSDAAELEQLCVTTNALSLEGHEPRKIGWERSVDVDCLERRLTELIKNSCDVENHSINHRTLGCRASKVEVDAESHSSVVEPQKQYNEQQPMSGKSETRDIVPDDVATNIQQHQESKSTKGDKKRASSSRKRKNRKARKLGQLKNDGFFEPKPGPSGRCGCGCGACNGCMGRSRPESPDKVRSGDDVQHGHEGIESSQSCSLEVSGDNGTRSKDSSGSETHHGRMKAGVNPYEVNQSESVNANDGSAPNTAASSSDPTEPFIDITFGDCDPVRIYKGTRRQKVFSRPFYAPLDRSMAPGMDAALGDGAMARLIASGLDMDDFIVTEGSGRSAVTMFLWPGPPTRPCIDLVTRRIHLRTNFLMHDLHETLPELKYLCIAEQNSLNSSKDTETSKQPPPNKPQVVEGEDQEKGIRHLGSAGHRSGMEGGVGSRLESITSSTKRSLPEEPETVTPPSNMPSPVDTTDAKHQDETQSLQAQDLTGSKSATSKSTEVCNNVTTQEASSTIASHKSASTSIQHCAIADIEHASVDQLHSEETRMEIRRRARKVRRARKTAQHLRRVRRSYLHTAETIRARCLAQQLSTRGPLWKNGSRRRCVTKGGFPGAADVPADAVPDTNVHMFREQLGSAFGLEPQSPSLRRPASAEVDPQAHRVEVAVNDGNIIDVYNTVARIAEDTSVREVEVELRPKDSPTPALQKLDRARPPHGQQGVVAEADLMSSQTEANVQCEVSREEIPTDVPLSPHAKAGGPWNGNRPEDVSTEVTAYAEETQPATCRSPSSAIIPGSISCRGMSADNDLMGDFEELELGKLISSGDELKELKQQSSSQIAESHTSEPTDTERAASGACGSPARYGPSFSVSVGTPRRQSPPWAGRPLDALLWDPHWVRSPPLSPRSRLWTIFSKLRPARETETSPAPARLSTDLLPGADEVAPSDVGQPTGEHASDSVHRPVPRAIRGTHGPTQELDLRPEALITSAYLQPEDNLIAHGDPARPWVHGPFRRTPVKTLADQIVRRQPRWRPAFHPVR